jgi:hypothetical protein
MRKIEMTFLPMIGLVAKYKSLKDACHHKTHDITKWCHCKRHIILHKFRCTTHKWSHHMHFTKLQVKSIWVFDTYDLDYNIAATRLSQILSIDMSFVEEVESPDTFWSGACLAYLWGIACIKFGSWSHLWKCLSSAWFLRMKLWRHIVAITIIFCLNIG